jgi:beta-glucosidase
LFAYGFGLSYADDGSLALLPEDSGLSGVDSSNTGRFIEYGSPIAPWTLNLRDDSGNAVITDVRGSSPSGAVTVVPLDDQAQEDTMLVTWTGAGSLVLDGQPVNLQRETNGDLVLEVRYRVLEPSSGAVSFAMGRGADWRGSVDITGAVNAAAGQDWQVSRIRMACFDDAGALMESITEPFVVSGEAGLKLQINTARLVANPGNASCEP